MCSLFYLYMIITIDYTQQGDFKELLNKIKPLVIYYQISEKFEGYVNCYFPNNSILIYYTTKEHIFDYLKKEFGKKILFIKAKSQDIKNLEEKETE